MRSTQRRILESRIAHEKRALETIPLHCAIDRLSIESELEELEQKLAALPEDTEEVVVLQGIYRGVLPGKSTFELQITDDQGNPKEIFGTVSPNINPDEMSDWNSDFNKRLVKITASKIVVDGSRPSYVAMSSPVVID